MKVLGWGFTHRWKGRDRENKEFILTPKYRYIDLNIGTQLKQVRNLFLKGSKLSNKICHLN